MFQPEIHLVGIGERVRRLVRNAAASGGRRMVEDHGFRIENHPTAPCLEKSETEIRILPKRATLKLFIKTAAAQRLRAEE